MEELKELQKQQKGLNAELAKIDKQLTEIEAKKQKHQDRLAVHDKEVSAAEFKVSTVVEKLARDTASEKDLDKAQALLDSLKGKRKNLADVLTVIENDALPLQQARADNVKKLEMIDSKVLAAVAQQIVYPEAAEALLRAYVIHDKRFGRLTATSIGSFAQVLVRDFTPPKKVVEATKPGRCEEILQPYLR